jgi:SAM-dependent methyltransferase
VTVLFALTLFLSASLMFIVEPMMGKLVLPVLGGTPAVWNTCVMFFQFVLLAGYLYAHVTATRLSLLMQAVLQIVLLAAGLATLPLALRGVESAAVEAPITSVLLILTLSVGLPLLAIAASAPLLQTWLASTTSSNARDPFFLYAVSNFGSLAALLSYPFLLEPGFRLLTQRRAWSAGYALLVILTAACAWLARRYAAGNGHAREGREPAAAREAGARPGAWTRGRWLLLAFVPSTMMLSTTTFISTDVAAMPLLWVGPLAIYLLTFVLAFAPTPLVPVRWLSHLLAPSLLTSVYFVYWPHGPAGLWVQILVHVCALTLTAFVCHGQLAAERPHPAHLTEYYFWISLGGLLGGVFNTLVAPLVFTGTAEYPMALACAAFLRPARREAARPTWRGAAATTVVAAGAAALALLMPASVAVPYTTVKLSGDVVKALPALLATFLLVAWPVRFALVLSAVMLSAGARPNANDAVLHAERTFFGTHKVLKTGEAHRLMHGTTTHGAQSMRPERACAPLTYYARTGPVGQVFESIVDGMTNARVGSVGLGAATMASYARPGQAWTFFEINPAVKRIAEDPRYFTYLRDCIEGDYRVVLGDARLELQREPGGVYDVLIFDAFSSDAIPVHLVTREAIQLYLRKLSPNGVLVFHISNRYLDLGSPLGNLARDAGLAAFIDRDAMLTRLEFADGKARSIWVAMARRAADLGLLLQNPQWEPAPVSAAEVWTDDYSNIVSVLKMWN